MTKLCKQYITQAKLLLPTVGRAEKKYLATMANNLEGFCETASPETIQDLYKEFGSPVDTVNSYISTLPAEDLMKRIQTSKYLRTGIVSLLLILTIITSIFGITTYQSFQVFKQESVFFTTTDVK